MSDTTELVAPTDSGCMGKFKSFVTTQKAIILSAEIVLCLTILICRAASYVSFYSTVEICEMVFAGVLYVVFMMELDKTFIRVSWIWTDFLRAIIGAPVLFFVSMVNLIRVPWRDGAWIAGGVLGMIAGLLFSYDTYTIYKRLKSSRQQTATSTDEKV